VNDLSSLIGKIAVTDSEMSPKGTVLIDDEVYEAVTDGEYIDSGRGVKVIRIKGKKIVVKRV
jgi:membrane-bound serine protease (ClpP class)